MSGQAQDKISRFRSEKLSREIERRVLTNEEFARMVDVPERTVRRWRSGTRPYPRHVRKMAEILGKDPYWFYVDDPEGGPSLPEAA